MTHKQKKNQDNKAAFAKPSDHKNVIILYVTQFITTSELLMSFKIDMLLSSEVKSI